MLPVGHAGARPAGPPAPLRRCAWGDAEISLTPPRPLLEWLIQNAELVHASALDRASRITRAKREGLLRRDPATIQEALQLLSVDRRPSRGWYVLEGPSRPDVYLESDRALVVIEGKRSETGATSSTTWMRNRHQMLRHLDCAWEVRQGRSVVGFFIVEGDGGADAIEPPKVWREAAETTVQPPTLASNLPHRGASERESIARCFLGVTTWQRVCLEFEIPWAALPDVAGT
jgi:hypothetical protein